MRPITHEKANEPEIKPMKRFVIREAETLKTTRPAAYNNCWC